MRNFKKKHIAQTRTITEHTNQDDTAAYCFLLALGLEAAGARPGGQGCFFPDDDDDDAAACFVFAFFCRAMPPSFCSESSTQPIRYFLPSLRSIFDSSSSPGNNNCTHTWSWMFRRYLRRYLRYLRRCHRHLRRRRYLRGRRFFLGRFGVTWHGPNMTLS